MQPNILGSYLTEAFNFQEWYIAGLGYIFNTTSTKQDFSLQKSSLNKLRMMTDLHNPVKRSNSERVTEEEEKTQMETSAHLFQGEIVKTL